MPRAEGLTLALACGNCRIQWKLKGLTGVVKSTTAVSQERSVEMSDEPLGYQAQVSRKYRAGVTKQLNRIEAAVQELAIVVSALADRPRERPEQKDHQNG